MIGHLSRKNFPLGRIEAKNKFSVAKGEKSCYNSLRNKKIPFKRFFCLINQIHFVEKSVVSLTCNAPSPPKITDTQWGVRYFYRNVEFELSQSALRFEKALQ